MLSHVTGPTDEPLLTMTIGAALDQAAARWGGREALVDRGQDVRLSWDALKARCDAFARGLLALGLAPGDRIGIWSLNRVEWAITQFAAAKAGLILVTINPAYRLMELEYALAESGCAAIVISPAFKTSDYPAMIRTLVPEMAAAGAAPIASARLPALRRVIEMEPGAGGGTIAFAAVEEAGRNASPSRLETIAAAIGCDDAVNIQFTSGTTGSPKGVTLTHRNILNNGYFTGKGIRLGPEDRLCIPVPLYHCFGMVMGNLACLTLGAAMVYPGEGFDPLATLEAVERERCTALYGVPTMFIAELEHPRFSDYDLSSLRTGVMAGASCPIEVMRKVADRMHMSEVTICYGMTETSPVSFQSATDDPLERRVSTVGRVHPHVEVKIVDEAGDIVPRGVRGELCTRGYSVMLGYWGRPEHTASVKDADGWMHSGDLATIDEEGFCNIVGRLKDMVIRGGENLYPREIEEFLYRHPDVRDVQIFGVPDARYGEELCAWVIPHDGRAFDADSLRRFCDGQIAHQKIPRYVKIVSEFPMTVTGKVQKYLMRAAMIEELGLEEPATA
ncbi:MAG TPA: AMP-binding protein [Allosphingosinicella sp.]|nr:AMP-binding protein [Allosphingosinicella sp.]